MRAIPYFAIGFVCFMAVTPSNSNAQFRQRTCELVVQERLDQLAVDRNDVSKVTYDPIYEIDAEDNRSLDRINAWVRFGSCRGALIIDMLPNCYVKQVYTRGECKVPGVKAF